MRVRVSPGAHWRFGRVGLLRQSWKLEARFRVRRFESYSLRNFNEVQCCLKDWSRTFSQSESWKSLSEDIWFVVTSQTLETKTWVSTTRAVDMFGQVQVSECACSFLFMMLASTGYSSVRLECMLWEHDVVSSNLAIPTQLVHLGSSYNGYYGWLLITLSWFESMAARRKYTLVCEFLVRVLSNSSKSKEIRRPHLSRRCVKTAMHI